MNKSILLIILFVAFAMSCNNKNNNKEIVVETVELENKMKTIHLTKTEFLTKVANYESNPTRWVYLGDKPALIDFYADWCGPCKAIAPVLEELAAEYDEEIYIYKIDTEKESELAAVFNIRSIPSLLFIPMDGQPQMTMGVQPKHQLKENIEKVLLKK